MKRTRMIYVAAIIASVAISAFLVGYQLSQPQIQNTTATTRKIFNLGDIFYIGNSNIYRFAGYIRMELGVETMIISVKDETNLSFDSRVYYIYIGRDPKFTLGEKTFTIVGYNIGTSQVELEF